MNPKTPPRASALQNVALALYALSGLAMALSAWLPYRVLEAGSAQVVVSGLKFTDNLAWILVACGAGSAVLGVVGLSGRSAPAYSVLLAPVAGIVFAGFFLLLYYQASPTFAGQRYLLVTDTRAWHLMKSANPRAAIGLGLLLTAASSLLTALLAYPVFRTFRSRKRPS